MKLVKFRGGLVVNIDRIDALSNRIYSDNETEIFIGGNRDSFLVREPIDEVIDKITYFEHREER